MRDIRSVMIVGAGAVGAAIASIIYKNESGALRVLADPERAARYEKGFVVNGETLRLPLASTQFAPAPGEEPDLILVAVKSHQLGKAIDDMAPFVGPQTLILSLLNGITSEDVLAAAFGREKLPYAMIIGIDAVREHGEVRFAGSGRINFGDAHNEPGEPSERVSRIASFFDRVGISYAIPEDMTKALWYKLMVNVGINQASAVLRAPYGTFQSLPEARRVMLSAMREVVQLSRALGTGLTESDMEAWDSTLRGLASDGKTSMLQDVEAGRKTEVEAFAGTIVELGSRAGVPTPVNALLFDLIRTIEQSY